MDLIPQELHHVFEFSKDETDFWPSEQFSADLRAS
jgi:hypothetical protein